jgi:hypothetical protein
MNATKKPAVKLVGKDGNVFTIIGLVRNGLRAAGLQSQAQEFVTRAFASSSYDEVLRLAMEYVEVK